MKAALLYELNKPLQICEIELSDLKVGQVLVKILVSGICGSQLNEIKGFKGNEKFLPHLLGHEGCGIVQNIGPGVSKVKVGDKVVMHWRVGLGIESEFPLYRVNGNYIASGKITTFSEYSIVSENRLTTVPNDTPDYLCALLGCGLTTALGVINNETDLKFGESIAIVGCGGVGLNLIQAAQLGSAYPIIAIDLNEQKKLLALNANADFFINPKIESIETCFNKFLPNGKVDIVIDTTGNPKIIDKMSNLLSNSGRLIMVGQPEPGTSIEFSNALNLFGTSGKIIKTTQGGKTLPHFDINRYINLFKNRNIKFEDIVTHSFLLSDINKAIQTLESGDAGRIMINMGH